MKIKYLPLLLTGPFVFTAGVHADTVNNVENSASDSPVSDFIALDAAPTVLIPDSAPSTVNVPKTAVTTEQSAKQPTQPTAKSEQTKASNINNKWPNSYYIPHTYISGYGGTSFIGQVDMLAPMLLRTDKNLFLYGQGKMGSSEGQGYQNTWSGSLGLGYRQVAGNRIYGGYLFTDYSNSALGNKFTTINPGFETLGERVDFRINGYIPVGTTSYATTNYASDMGNYDYTRAAGNTYYDHQLTYFDENNYGADAEVGVRLFSIKHMPIKAYLNGYYFAAGDNSDQLTGIGGRLTFQPTRYLSLEVKDTYDNQNGNVILGGVKVYLNGFRDGVTNTHVDDQSIQTRLFDPIERNLGSIASAAPASTLNNKSVDGSNNDNIIDDGEHAKLTNVEYVGGTVTDSAADQGTAENPFPTIDQNVIDQGNQQFTDATFMIAGEQGYGEASSEAGLDLNLYDDQSMYGMTPDYKAPATGNDKPIIYGDLTLNGHNTVDSMQFINTDSNYAGNGITVADSAQSVVISNTDVNSFNTGIAIGEVATVTLTNDNISATSNKGDTAATGLFADYGSKVNINGGTYSANNTATASSLDAAAVGINAADTYVNLTVTGATVNATSAVATTDQGAAIGLQANNAMNVDLENSTVNATNLAGTAVGIEAKDVGSLQVISSLVDVAGDNVTGISIMQDGTNVSTAKISGTKITVDSEMSESNNHNAIGVDLEGTSKDSLQVNINDGSLIDVTMGNIVNSDSFGIVASGAELNISDTTVNSTNNLSVPNNNHNVGILIQDGSLVNINDGTMVNTTSEAGDNKGLYILDSTVNMNGGSVNVNNGDNAIGVSVADSGTTFNMNGGSVNVTGDEYTTNVVGVNTDFSSTANIDGGTITVISSAASTSAGIYGIYATGSSNVTLDGGAINAQYNGANSKIPVYGIYVTNGADLNDISGDINVVGIANQETIDIFQQISQ